MQTGKASGRTSCWAAEPEQVGGQVVNPQLLNEEMDTQQDQNVPRHSSKTKQSWPEAPPEASVWRDRKSRSPHCDRQESSLAHSRESEAEA